MTRTDIHRPSVIQPADYSFVGVEAQPSAGIDDASYIVGERARIRAHMAQTGGRYSNHEHGGSCHVCGASAVYTVLFHHRPTNVYIRTGFDCADKLGCRDAALFRRHIDAAREIVAGKRKAQAALDAAGLTAAWAIYTAERVAEQRYEESTICDIVRKLVKYGSVSDRQLGFVRSLLDRIAKRAVIAAERAAEHAAAADVPVTDERVTVRGKVLSLREPDAGAPFPAWKMLVQTAAGYKLWGSRPSSLCGIERGSEVEFDATIKRSDRDSKFGFFSRPTKARVIESEAA